MSIADGFAAWLVALLAEAGRKKLTTVVLGSDQEQALHRAATAAQLEPPGGERVGHVAMVVGEVFAERDLRAVVQLLERLLGPDHPITSGVHHSLAGIQAGLATRRDGPA